MTIDNIREAIITLFNFTVFEETEEKIVFTIISDKTAILDKRQTQDVIDRLTLLNTEQDVELFGNNSYEVLVRQENRIMFSREITQKDLVNKIEYNIDKPTDEFLVFFLHNLAKQNTPRILRSGIMPLRLKKLYDNENSRWYDSLISKQDDKKLDQEPNLSEPRIFEVIKEIVPRLETLHIISDNSKKKTEYEQLVYAFLFNLGYNLNHTIQPLRFIDEFTQSYKLGRIRRANLGDVEPPKRVYLNELILHYQKGISSESIDHQFLSFYHVLEHFYEKIYNDDILNSIKSELTKPSFSYKRNKDISNLVGLIQSRLKYKNDEFQLNEPEALELTLKKFIKDIPFLASELGNISPTLIDYYKSTDVPFSKGNRVNFETANLNEIYTNLAKRIYLTRNSIVHSKETDKIKYTPFRDDKDLLMEIYLMRLIAEIVIIENSKEL